MTPVAFDTTLRRPACVLVAAALGASTVAAQRFPSETWLLALTDGMRVYDMDDALLERLVTTVREEARGG